MWSSSWIDPWSLLFLIYINDLPNCLQFTTTRMFTDDTNRTASGKSISEVEQAPNLDPWDVKEWLSANKLCLNIVKTEYRLSALPITSETWPQNLMFLLEISRLKESELQKLLDSR